LTLFGIVQKLSLEFILRIGIFSKLNTGIVKEFIMKNLLDSSSGLERIDSSSSRM
jgi:hypothetical protein